MLIYVNCPPWWGGGGEFQVVGNKCIHVCTLNYIFFMPLYFFILYQYFVSWGGGGGGRPGPTLSIAHFSAEDSSRIFAALLKVLLPFCRPKFWSCVNLLSFQREIIFKNFPGSEKVRNWLLVIKVMTNVYLQNIFFDFENICELIYMRNMWSFPSRIRYCNIALG